MKTKAYYKCVFNSSWKIFYIRDYFWDKGYIMRQEARLKTDGQRGYDTMIVLYLESGAFTSPVASLNLSEYTSEDPEEAIHALELLLMFS
jgi:hypothetical protein